MIEAAAYQNYDILGPNYDSDAKPYLPTILLLQLPLQLQLLHLLLLYLLLYLLVLYLLLMRSG